MPARKYQPSVFDNIENIEKYVVGGFHPVHIGDTFDNGRYRIVHKLGYGGFATVWLARDRERNSYVALKITTAEESKDCAELNMYRCLKDTPSSHLGRKYVACLVDYFWIEGPNGSHVCLVSSFVGVPISHFSQTKMRRRFRGDVAQKIALGVTEGLAFLHSIGVRHGDFTPSNTLLQLTNLDCWSEEQVYERLGQLYKDKLYALSSNTPGPCAPAYIVEAISDIKAQYVTENTLIIDFGQSFFHDSPPSGGIGTPWSYRAPEAIFDLKASIYSDMWALACTIFEIHAGEQLLEAFFSDQEEILVQLVQTLGKLPERWWYAWEGRLTYFDEDGKPKQKWPNNRPLASLHALIDYIKDIGSEDASGDDSNHDSTENIPDHESDSGGLFAHANSEASSTGRGNISSEEVASLHDLLSRMLTYAPEDRIPAEGALRHPWFTEKF